MKIKIMLSVCISTLLLSGCQKDEGEPISNNQNSSTPEITSTSIKPIGHETPDHNNIQPNNVENKPQKIITTFSAIKSDSQKINVTASSINRVDVALTNVKLISKPNEFQFSNIQLVQNGLNVTITNPTPQNVKRFTATLGDSTTIVMIELDTELPAYSEGILSSSTVTLTKIKLIDQLHFFKPKVQIAGFVDSKGAPIDCSIAVPNKACYGAPNENERLIYEIVLTNMHNAFNRNSLFKAFNKYFADSTECSQFECKNYTDTKLSYAERNFLAYGMKDHKLGMKVMRNHYAADGVGGGSMPDLNYSVSFLGGWASYWEEHLDPNNQNYRPYSNNTYNVVWHEGAHAYGFSHASGMTYGFQSAWSFSPSHGDSWGGSGNSFIDTQITKQERENRSEIKLPSVIIKQENISKYKINLSFSYPYYESTPSTIMLSYLTNKEVNFISSYVPDSDTVTLTFDKPLEAPLYIRAMAKDKDYMSTIVINNGNIIPSKNYIIDRKKYSILADEILDKAANGWNIRKTCSTQGGMLATKDEYQKLWDYLINQNKLSELVKTKFLTRDEPTGYRIWQVDFQSNAMISNYFTMTKPLGNENGLLCISDID